MPDDNEGGYWVDDDIEKRFFKNSKFCLSLKKYLHNLLSMEVEISLQAPLKRNRRSNDAMKYRIWIVHISETKPEMQQVMSDRIKQLFQTIKSKSKKYDDDKVLKWFNWFVDTKGNLTFLQNLVNRKLNSVITVFEKSWNSLHIYCSPELLANNIDTEKFDYFLQHEILQETIPLPLPHERSSQLDAELKKIESDETIKDDVLIVHNSVYLKTKQKEITLFGYDKKVNELKKKISDIIERHVLITYKLDPTDTFLIEYLVETHSDELREIEKKYKPFGVDIRVGLNEFSSPRHLKNQIESSIQQLLSQSSSTTTKNFASIQLFKDIAEKQDKYLKFIAQKNRCYIKTELEQSYQFYSIPKASVSDNQVSKSIITQSELFCSSFDVFKKMIVGNSSIELRTGDIALQNVDALIISTTFNGLKEGVIERAGEFDYEKTYLQPDGTMYTETDGGKLNCKRILFSNWLPTSLINNDNSLRLSIQSFISKSIEYTKDTSSIAFAIPDSCTDEFLLAKEMIAEAKRQIEINKLELKILFVLLPEQQTLYEQFSNFIQTTEDVYAYFDWPMTTIKITLISTDAERATGCQEKITKYLSRSIGSAKVTYPNGIFQSWNQHVINSFYKYCKDRCILPKLDETQNEIELIGPASGIEETKKKLYILSELVKEKVQYTSMVERPSSARSGNNKIAKLYNIVVSFSRKDIRKCQRLINRLTEEGFSVGTDPNITEGKRHICSQMDKSDCIILCISENYYENVSCIEEAKYAFHTDKKVFLVKIQNNPLLGWNDSVFERKLFFHSFGSDNYFDLEYGRLLLELLRYTKPGFSSLLQRRSSFMQQSNAEVREISKTERSGIVNPNQKSITSTRQLSFTEERWLRKLADIPKPNLSLYSVYCRGVDYDEVPAERPADSLSTNSPFPVDRRLHCSHLNHPITKQTTSQIWADEDQPYGKCTEKIQIFTGLSQVFPREYSTVDFIPRRTTNNYFVSGCYNACRNDEEIEERRKFENPEEMKHVREKLAKYFIETYKCYTEEELDGYLEFAQRMKDNTTAFETFCSRKAIAN